MWVYATHAQNRHNREVGLTTQTQSGRQLYYLAKREMEVMVNIRQAWIKDTSRFILRCKVQDVGASKETHESSVAIGQPTKTSGKPNFAFTFVTKPQEISLSFIAITPRQETTPNLENELGKCDGNVNTTTSQHTQNLMFTRLIEGTNVETFAGKLTYTVHLSAAVGVDLQSLLADEDRQACLHVLPSETPFISVVFNSAYARINPTSKLVGIARIGDRSDINVDMLLKSSSNELQSVPFLKPAKLTCQEFDCLELHIAERSATVLFSISRPINRLAPFKPIHYRYDGQTGGQSTKGNVSISVLYTPSSSLFNRFMGLEVVVCEVNLPRDVAQCRNIVMGTQIVQKNSKMKSPTLECHSILPPFHSLTKKGATTVNPSIDHDYRISVLRYHGRELNTALVKCYFLFSYPSKNPESIDLVFHIYGSSGNELWWNTDYCVAATLEVTKETLSMLQTGEHSNLNWKTSNQEPCNVSGILRWKSKQTPFFSESSVREAFATQTQPLNNSILVNKASFTTDLHKEGAPTPFNPTKTSPRITTSDHKRMDKEHASGEQDNIFSRLAEFESMLKDFQILGKEKQCLQEDIEELQLQVTKVKSLVKATPQTQDDLQLLPLSDLLLKVSSLQQNLQAEEKAHERCRIRNQQLQSDLIARQDLETQYAQLHEEHTAQKRLVQLLRDKLSKYHKCSEICKKQESVITQLESLLAKQAEGQLSTKDDAFRLLVKENLHLRGLVHQYQNIGDHSQQLPALLDKDQTIQSLKSQLSQLFSHCQKLENKMLSSDRNGRDRGGGRKLEKKVKFETRVFEMEQKLLVAEAKLNAQTSQLQENAEKWMREKTQYELKLAAIQSRLDTVMKSGQQVLSTVHTEAPRIPEKSEAQRQDEGNVQRYISGKINTKEFSF